MCMVYSTNDTAIAILSLHLTSELHSNMVHQKCLQLRNLVITSKCIEFYKRIAEWDKSTEDVAMPIQGSNVSACI